MAARYTCPVCAGPKWSDGPRPCRKCDHIGDRRPRACEVCATTYTPTHSLQRSCGRACGVVLRRMDGLDPWPVSAVSWRQCRRCERWYTTKGKKRCDCGTYKPTSGVRSVQCRDCGKPFDYVIVSSYPARCTDCRTLHKAAVRRDNRKKRRAKQRGAQTEPVNVTRVYERDRWCCGLCGKRVDKRLRYPHPRSASLDHVLPLSCGGAHSMANVQLAHLECNHTKSDGGNQQLALVG